MVLGLPLFRTGKFANHFLNNLLHPKRIERVEEHAKDEHNVREMPRKTGCARRIGLLLPRGRPDIPPHFRTHKHSKDGKVDRKHRNVGNCREFRHVCGGSHKDEIDRRNLHHEHGHDDFRNSVPAEIRHDRQGRNSVHNLK